MKRLLFLIVIVFSLYGCKKEGTLHKPIDGDSEKPGVVSNIRIENFAGGATIHYDLPASADLQYVLAEYKINKESTREAKVSAHVNSLKVEGFEDAGDYEVNLYAVDRSGNRSEVTQTQVHPLTPTFRKVFQTLNLLNDFGGASVTFENQVKGNVGLVFLVEDNNGDLKQTDALYTSVAKGSFSVRGFDTIERVFGVYVKDRWNNRSDTIVKKLKPMYELELNKNLFAEYQLPDDAPKGYTSDGYTPQRSWDNKIEDYAWHTVNTGSIKLPIQVTMDLGVVARLSRFKIWDRPGKYIFAHFNPRKYVIWGRSTHPNPAGGYDGWIRMRECESIKPSGLPVGQNNADDVAAAAAGMEFGFEPGLPAVRYIRIQVLETWGNAAALHFSEISFWGDVQK